MAGRLTFSGVSTGVAWPDAGAIEGFGNEYARHVKTLYDASVLPLTGTAGTANAVTTTLAPVFDAEGLKERMKFTIVWAATNTGPVTLSVNGGAAKAVVDNAGNALTAGSLTAGLMSLLEYVGGSFRVHAPLVVGGGAKTDYKEFTASGTWTKPAGLSASALLIVQLWAGGGGGTSGVGGLGGGGGGYAQLVVPASAVPASVAVTIGSGGATNTDGGNTTFGTLATAYGGERGGAASGAGGRGGGEVESGSSGGRIGGGARGTSTTAAGDAGTIYGGGGGAGSMTNPASAKNGGASVNGGGGGGASSNGLGGPSVNGGAGGNAGAPGTVPGGGGGAGAAGAAGRVRVLVVG